MVDYYIPQALHDISNLVGKENVRPLHSAAHKGDLMIHPACEPTAEIEHVLGWLWQHKTSDCNRPPTSRGYASLGFRMRLSKVSSSVCFNSMFKSLLKAASKVSTSFFMTLPRFRTCTHEAATKCLASMDSKQGCNSQKGSCSKKPLAKQDPRINVYIYISHYIITK